MNAIPVFITGQNRDPMVAAYHTKLQRNPGDCGVDLYPCFDDPNDITIKDFGFYSIISVPTKVNLAIPAGHFGLITGRSSSPDKLMGCMVLPGVIDHGYTGEYRIRVQMPSVSVNVTRANQLVSKIIFYAQQRIAIAQAIMLPFAQVSFHLADVLPETGRGANGFGSTDSQPLGGGGHDGVMREVGQ